MRQTRGNKTPNAVHEANVAGLHVDETPRRVPVIDNTPTPAEVAAIAIAAATPAEVDAATTIYEAAMAGWTHEQVNEFWSYLR